MITKKDFVKVGSTISVILILALVLISAVWLADPVSITNWFYIFLVPVIFLCGLIWFIANVIKYVKGKFYVENPISIKSVGWKTGFVWFVIVEIIVIITVIIGYYVKGEVCSPFLGSSYPCSLADYLFGRREFEAFLGLVAPFVFLFPVSIVMFVIGYFVDKSTRKENIIS